MLNFRCIFDQLLTGGHLKRWQQDAYVITNGHPRALSINEIADKELMLATLNNSAAATALSFEHLLRLYLRLRASETSKSKFTDILATIRTDLPYSAILWNKAQKGQLKAADLPNRSERLTTLKSYMHSPDTPDSSAYMKLIKLLAKQAPNTPIPGGLVKAYKHATGSYPRNTNQPPTSYPNHHKKAKTHE